MLRNFIFDHYTSAVRLDKAIVHKMVFLVSLKDWRSKRWDVSQFWALGHLLTASKWLESIWGHNGPALAVNVIPEPGRNRANRIKILCTKFEENWRPKYFCYWRVPPLYSLKNWDLENKELRAMAKTKHWWGPQTRWESPTGRNPRPGRFQTGGSPDWRGCP